MQTTALIRECLPVAGLVALVDDYLCPVDATNFSVGQYGHGERYCDTIVEARLGACVGGHADLVRIAAARGYTKWDAGLLCACEGGDAETIDLVIELGANDWNAGLRGACRGGHVAVAEAMIKRGAKDRNGGLNEASIHGRLNTAKLMIKRGATDIHWYVHIACIFGRYQLAEIMVRIAPLYVLDVNRCLGLVCGSNCPPVAVVTALIARGADVNSCSCGGAKHQANKD